MNNNHRILLILFLDEMLSSRNPRATHARIVLLHAAPSRAELDGLRPIKTFERFLSSSSMNEKGNAMVIWSCIISAILGFLTVFFAFKVYPRGSLYKITLPKIPPKWDVLDCLTKSNDYRKNELLFDRYITLVQMIDRYNISCAYFDKVCKQGRQWIVPAGYAFLYVSVIEDKINIYCLITFLAVALIWLVISIKFPQIYEEILIIQGEPRPAPTYENHASVDSLTEYLSKAIGSVSFKIGKNMEGMTKGVEKSNWFLGVSVFTAFIILAVVLG